MKNFDELKATVQADRKAGKLTRGKAIRYHCLDCMGYQTAEVTRCKSKWCPPFGSSAWVKRRHSPPASREENQNLRLKRVAYSKNRRAPSHG